MSHDSFALTRRSLHGIAELVLAGPQYATHRTIRLQVTPGGFGTVSGPAVHVEDLDLVTTTRRVRLDGTFRALARAAGLEPRALRDVYADSCGVGEGDPIVIDHEAARMIFESFALGDAALRAFAADQQPVLWPEHFDLGITLEAVNYGVSPGDSHQPAPYAYIGPWAPRDGDFWNASFGATRSLTEIGDVSSLTRFFQEGARRAGADPLRAD
jgi:hypothetical protein